MAIPALIVLISLFEVSRAMWCYGGLAHALEESVRFAIAKTENCSTAGGACRVTVGELAAHIKEAGATLGAGRLELSFISPAGTITCEIESCLKNTAWWPPAAVDPADGAVSISGKYTLDSATEESWIGAGPAAIVGKVSLPTLPRRQPPSKS